MNRTTLRDRIATTQLRRLTATALAGSLFVLATAAPVQARSFGGDGIVYAVADCNLATKKATVSVVAMEPAKYASSGLVFYTEVWAKARSASRYDLIRGAQSPVIKTWSQYNPNPFVSNQLSWMNSPKSVLGTAFSGRYEDYYDIYVRIWFRLPTSTTWTGSYDFTVAGDPHSSITITSNDGYGNLSSPASNCYL
jgi:hypothetical protein